MKQIGENIVFENDYCKLTVNASCEATSLIFKQTGEECLFADETMALFSLTQQRPFTNEVKLAHMNKLTTYQANRVRIEDGKLVLGFEEVNYEAVVSVVVAPAYITFTLEDMIVPDWDEKTLKMDKPAVLSFRLVQLPLKHRKNFGEWLNIVSDETVTVGVVGTSQYELVDSEKYKRYRTLYARAQNGVKLRGAKAALIVSPTASFMDVMEGFEQDFDLPRGVASRRDQRINNSLLRVPFISPENVDDYIGYAKKAGLKNMLIYYTAMFEEGYIYDLIGNYDWRACYPNKEKDLKLVLDKLKAAGIMPGLHFLHTHIGINSRYVTPVPDHRLNLKQHYTLARPITENDDVIYVEQPLDFAPKHEKCRVLKFGTELIYYDRAVAEKPYRFEGCVRGYNGTTAAALPQGYIGGLLDISEFGGVSLHLDQNSDLQEEIAGKLANAYNQGFEFCYFDGSEGTDAPYEYNVPNAQLRLYKQLNTPPVFSEGAAKSHFSWHLITGGNAFDMWPNDVFKKMIVQFPFIEAEQMRADYTRVNFGWWALNNETQPDMYEFGMSRAAAWDCPTTVNAGFGTAFKENARIDDILEVVRRWEDARVSGWLTEEQKIALRDPKQEHIMLINEAGEYEMVPYALITEEDSPVRAFGFERGGKPYVVCWHRSGKADFEITLDAPYTYEEELGKDAAPSTKNGNKITLSVENRRYFSVNIDKETLFNAFKNGKIKE